MISRSNSLIAARMDTTSRPCGLVVSTAVSRNDLKLTPPLPSRSSTLRRRQVPTFADRKFVQKAIAAGRILVTETFSAAQCRPSAREIKFSIAGLEQALSTPLKNCGAT
jgi:hypothetical protein